MDKREALHWIETGEYNRWLRGRFALSSQERERAAEALIASPYSSHIAFQYHLVQQWDGDLPWPRIRLHHLDEQHAELEVCWPSLRSADTHPRSIEQILLVFALAETGRGWKIADKQALGTGSSEDPTFCETYRLVADSPSSP